MVLHIISSLGNGGAEAVLYRLCLADPETDHVVVSLTSEGDYGKLLNAQGIEVFFLGMPRGKVSLSGLLRLWRILREYQPEVVQTWMYHADFLGGVMARLARIPKVFWNIRHTELEFGASSNNTILIARICAKFSRIIPTAIVCCGQRAAEIHKDLGYDERRMLVIRNGCDLCRFYPDPSKRQRLRTELGLKETSPIMGFIARFNPQKDHENLFAAIALLNASGYQLQCVLVGSGITRDNHELMQLISKYDLHEQLYLLGLRRDIPALMNSLDIHVMASAFGEGFPNTLAEAMACGTPCVTTDVGDAARIVAKTGWITPPRDPQALARNLAQAFEALQNIESWQHLQVEARARVSENFSLESMTNAYRALWHSS